MNSQNSELLLELIQHRRSIKPVDYDPNKAVTRSILEKLFEAAIQAPSHGMTEPWRFSVFQGASRERLANKLQEVYRKVTLPSEFKQEKYHKLRDTPLQSPVVITIGMDRPENSKIPEIEEIEAVACAVQNMHLMASTLGLGAYWSSPPVVFFDEVREFVGLSERGKVLGLFYVGWPKANFTWPKGRRQSVETKVNWNP